MRYDVRCMNTKFEMEWIEFGLLFNKNCDSSLLLRWKFEHNFNLSFQRLNRGKSNSCVQWILGLFENVRIIANTEKAGLKISKISKISYRQFAHLFLGRQTIFNSPLNSIHWFRALNGPLQFEFKLNFKFPTHKNCHWTHPFAATFPVTSTHWQIDTLCFEFPHWLFQRSEFLLAKAKKSVSVCSICTETAKDSHISDKLWFFVDKIWSNPFKMSTIMEKIAAIESEVIKFEPIFSRIHF